LGNARSARREISLKFWGAQGTALSAGPELTSLEQALLGNPPRTARSSGSLARCGTDADYLTQLAPAFHALRPLTVGIDCTNAPWWAFLKQLTRSVACRFESAPRGTHLTSSIVSGPWPSSVTTTQPCDFRLWIDGDGEACRLWDERGQPVSEHQLLLLLAQRTLRLTAKGIILVPAKFPAAWRRKITRWGGRVELTQGAARQALDQQMRQQSALLGLGAEGRYWFAGNQPSPDALRVLALLLNLLSESDEPLSQRLADLAG
jgi:phosphomannomutase